MVREVAREDVIVLLLMSQCVPLDTTPIGENGFWVRSFVPPAGQKLAVSIGA